MKVMRRVQCFGSRRWMSPANDGLSVFSSVSHSSRRRPRSHERYAPLRVGARLYRRENTCKGQTVDAMVRFEEYAGAACFGVMEDDFIIACDCSHEVSGLVDSEEGAFGMEEEGMFLRGELPECLQVHVNDCF